RASALESLCRKVLRPFQASTPAPQNDPKRPGINRENRDRSRFFAAPSSTEPSRTVETTGGGHTPAPRPAARCPPTSAPRSAPAEGREPARPVGERRTAAPCCGAGENSATVRDGGVL